MYSSKQDLFYEQVDGNLFQVMIRSEVYPGQPNAPAHLFTAWMLDTIPERLRIIETRVDHFFGDGRYMMWMVNKSELTLIKLAHTIKSKAQWVDEYHNRTRVLMEKIKMDMALILNTSLTRNLENAFIESAFTTKAVNQLSTMIGKPTDE